METTFAASTVGTNSGVPYSLGKPIEWKLDHLKDVCVAGCRGIPYSLGKPIEWKRYFIDFPVSKQGQFPTRQGNQLNGNVVKSIFGDVNHCLFPYSLGKPIEWKPIVVSPDIKCCHCFPTRQGNQLNGNSITHSMMYACAIVFPTRQGNQLNGNDSLVQLTQTDTVEIPYSLGKPIEWKPAEGI